MLNNKRILFFAPKTFGYEESIGNKLQELGSYVLFRDDRPIDNKFVKALVRIFPKLMWPFCDLFYHRWFKNNLPIDFDEIFVIRGEGLSPSFIKLLKSKNPNAIFRLYLWDSVKNVKRVEEKFFLFDRIYSYDPFDCDFYGLNFRPLFFLDKYLDLSPKLINNSACFVGTLHSDRANVISKFISLNEERVDLNFRVFLRSKLEYYFNCFVSSHFRSLSKSSVIFRPLGFDTVNAFISSSTYVLDIEHPQNNGLTMRTFEMLAAGKKLITTNKNIINFDFYDPQVIFIIDRNSPMISIDFLESNAVDLPSVFYEKYSLQGWLEDVFS